MQYFIEDWFQSNGLFIATITDSEGLIMIDTLYSADGYYCLGSGKDFKFDESANNIIYIY